MFIVTAQVVKPVNRDDLPRIPAVENMKNGSLLGIEPKSTDVKGPTGFIISQNPNQNAPATSTPATNAAPAKIETPSTTTPAEKPSGTGVVSTTGARNPNQPN